MPLIGIHKETGKRINILDYEFPKLKFKRGSLQCQLCSEELIIKHGTRNIQHLAHKVGCSANYLSHPESAEHQIAKYAIAKSIKSDWPEYSECDVQLEKIIESKKRVIDIAMIFKTGWIVAHEIQLSAISVKDISERTQDYLDEGIDVIWWLGKSADTPENREWCIRQYGHCYLLNYEILEEKAEEFRRRSSRAQQSAESNENGDSHRSNGPFKDMEF